jgi:hypothetical protein
MDVSDLLLQACRRDLKVQFDRCCESKPAPPSLINCARRVLDVALAALGPPVSNRVDVHVCHIVGQLRIQITAGDRHSFARLLATNHSQRALAELSVWLGAFSPLYSLEPLRRDRANIAAILPFDFGATWALPKCSQLHFGRP